VISRTKCSHYIYVCVIALINECSVVVASGASHLIATGFILNSSCLPIVFSWYQSVGVELSPCG